MKMYNFERGVEEQIHDKRGYIALSNNCADHLLGREEAEFYIAIGDCSLSLSIQKTYELHDAIGQWLKHREEVTGIDKQAVRNSARANEIRQKIADLEHELTGLI